METSQSDKRIRSAGFSVLEVLLAITILTIGLSAMAFLVAQSLKGTETARYMALSTTLASEKLEDLNRWRAVDPHVAAGGSLTSDAAVGTLNCYDDIDLSSTTGQVSETVSVTTGYSSMIHKSTGEVINNSNTSAPTGTGVVGFHRRWLIESNPIVNGVTLTGIRRVTVIVTLNDTSVRPLVSFQMSTVRP